MTLDADTCYRAICARDGRFDGVFFVGVATTGVYCRPVCPARTPRRDRVSFFRTAAEAEQLGYRACFRCRPELAPGRATIDAVPALVARAVSRIDSGFLDDRSVDELAAELGVTARHLRRATARELGVTLIELAQTRRLAFAKQLLSDTQLSLADVAFASGFSSVRRFNAALKERYLRPPSALRRKLAARPERGVVLRLDYRLPFDAPALLEFLAARAIPGVSEVAGGSYRRSVRIGDRTGTVAISIASDRAQLRVEVSPSLARALSPIVRSVRSLFDLDAHPTAIASALERDPELATLVRRRPGLRVPGAFEPFETAVFAVLGQQVSVRAARTLAGRLAARFGTALASPDAGVTTLFPDAATLANASAAQIARIGLPRPRAEALRALARGVACGEIALGRGLDPEPTRRALLALPGIGPWTAQYVCMRALGDPDAFPAGDLGLRRALGDISARELALRAERWRPWRAYAAAHLWSSLQGATKP